MSSSDSEWNPRLYTQRIEIYPFDKIPLGGYTYEVYEEWESDAGPISSVHTVRVPSFRECVSKTIAEMEKTYGAADLAKGEQA